MLYIVPCYLNILTYDLAAMQHTVFSFNLTGLGPCSSQSRLGFACQSRFVTLPFVPLRWLGANARQEPESNSSPPNWVISMEA